MFGLAKPNMFLHEHFSTREWENVLGTLPVGNILAYVSQKCSARILVGNKFV